MTAPTHAGPRGGPRADRWGVPVALGDRRILRPGRWRRLRALAWMVAFVFIVALAFGPTMESVTAALPKDSAALQFLVRCLGAVLALGVYALLVRLVEARSPDEVAPRPGLVGVPVGLGLGVLMMAAVMAVMFGAGLYDFTFTGWAPAWDGAGLAVQAGVVEELMIRGIVLRLVWRAFGPWAGFVVSALLFGAGHLGNADSSLFAALCIALEAGVVLGALYALTGRLWVPIGFHIGWNFAQGYLFGAAVSGSDTGAALGTSTARGDLPTWLTGGAFGPEASVPSLLLLGTVGAVALWLAWKAGRFAKPAATPQP